MCQNLCNRAKKLIKKDAWMKFYDASRPLYLETSASGVGLGARLMQVQDGMNCGYGKIPDNEMLHPIDLTSKHLLSAEQCNSNLEQETFGILHGLEKFYDHCFAKEVCVITDHKALVAIISKDVDMPSKYLQHIMLHIYQYRVHIICKCGADLYIADWLP